MRSKRAAAITIVIALAGLAIGGVIASVHRALSASGFSGSFCNVNDVLSCDLVLSSEYAYFLGVPVAWWAMAAYLMIAVAAAAAGWAPRASQRRQAASLVFIAAVVSVICSVFLAYVSFVELRAVCLFCSGLYVVNLALIASASVLFAAARTAAREQEAWQERTRMITGGAVVASVLLIATIAWKASGRGGDATPDPGFAEWYNKQPVLNVEVDGGHAKGDQAGKVLIVEFSDFECGHCARAYRTLKTVLPRFQKDVQLRFHHFPLDASCNPAIKQQFHKYACLAAMAAECAGAQGKFWEYHDLLFEHQTALDRDSLFEYADRVGLERAQFVACLDSDAPRQAIARDVAEAIRLNVESTPTFYLNGRALPGAREPAELEAAIRLERAARTKSAS